MVYLFPVEDAVLIGAHASLGKALAFPAQGRLSVPGNKLANTGAVLAVLSCMT